jgi:hypothetical protein
LNQWIQLTLFARKPYFSQYRRREYEKDNNLDEVDEEIWKKRKFTSNVG